MATASREHLLNFISKNQLKKEDGIICFDALVSFYKPSPFEINSEIQIISLPNEHALYIINHPENLAASSDVYSTAAFDFVHTGSNELEIADNRQEKLLTITLKT